ncbi:unnamed protein product [Candidula unifasciata]|uniref:Presenilin n=1 Tax=Candidula unifasciata TaxID=100452 RepID=A0A8S4A3T6_9EUPU|nr:unnamed protein product [Candidula unifasciata]
MESSSAETGALMCNSLDAGDGCVMHQLLQRCRRSEEHDNMLKKIETSEEEMSDEASLLNINTNRNQDKGRKSHIQSKKKSSSGYISKHDITHQEEEEAFVQGSRHMIMLFVPVTLCMIVVVATIASVSYYSETNVYFVYTPFHDKTEDTTTIVWQSTANAMILLCLIIVMTLVLLTLYTFRFYKIINGWLMIASVILLFFFGFVYLQQILRAFNVPMDYITVSLLLWNFGVGGIFCIHWKGPLLLQQAYLIVISAFVALTFIKHMPEWTTWAMLGVLVIWDLFAVLYPKGPLRLLVETAQQRNEPTFPFPALIYSSTMLWQITVADSDQTELDKKQNLPNKSGERESRPLPAASGEFSAQGTTSRSAGAAQPPLNRSPMPAAGAQLPSTSAQIQSAGAHMPLLATDASASRNEEKMSELNVMSKQDFPRDVASLMDSSDVDALDSPFMAKTSFESDVDDLNELGDGSPTDPPAVTSKKPKQQQSKSAHLLHHRHSRPSTKPSHTDRSKSVTDDKEDRGVKLGLGDFVFYGVLVGKASAKGDWNTTIACFVAILIGLCCTLLLLAIFRKALPALPISLTFGLVFNFATSILVKPFMESLASEQVYI